MPVESAADRAAMFSDDEFAVLAAYVPPVGPSSVVSIIFNHDRDRQNPFELGTGSNSGMRAALARQGAMILADQVAIVVLGADLVPGTMVDDEFVPGPDTFKIASRPRLDETGAIWSFDLQQI